jgi:hypothetical protein
MVLARTCYLHAHATCTRMLLARTCNATCTLMLLARTCNATCTLMLLARTCHTPCSCLTLTLTVASKQCLPHRVGSRRVPYCATGFGASIGSVGPHADVNCVRNITFRNISMPGTGKGIYVKSNPTCGVGSNAAGELVNKTGPRPMRSNARPEPPRRCAAHVPYSILRSHLPCFGSAHRGRHV